MQMIARLVEGLVATMSLAFGLIAVPAVVALPALHILGRTFDLPGAAELEDLEVLFFFGLVMLSIGYTYLRDRHVRVDVWRERAGARVIAAIEIVGCLAVLVPLCAIMIWVGGESAWRSLLLGERMSEFGGWPIKWLVRACVPLGFALLLAAGVAIVIRNGLFLVKGIGGPAPSDGSRPTQIL